MLHIYFKNKLDISIKFKIVTINKILTQMVFKWKQQHEKVKINKFVLFNILIVQHEYMYIYLIKQLSVFLMFGKIFFVNVFRNKKLSFYKFYFIFCLYFALSMNL